jgi:hypothetical protein
MSDEHAPLATLVSTAIIIIIIIIVIDNSQQTSKNDKNRIYLFFVFVPSGNLLLL